MNNRNYSFWTIFQALSAIFLVLFSLSEKESSAVLITAAVLYLNMGILIFSSGKKILRLSNLVTMIRTFGTIPLIYFRWNAEEAWPAVLFYLIFLEFTDLADGFIARRRGPTAEGARLDEETDSLFTLVLSLLLYFKTGFGSWILFFGAVRYIFVLFFLITGKTEKYPASFSRFSRITCAFTVSALIGGFALFLPLFIRSAALYTAFIMLGGSFIWEAVIHLRSGMSGRFSGLFRSFIIYYLIPGKSFRMKKLYSIFLKPGSLAFDIGSHIGNRIGVWSNLGVSIIALEPDPVCIRIIKAIHGKRKNLTLLQAAAGEVKGKALLFIDPLHPTLSTLSKKWIERVKQTEPFSPVEWTETAETDVTTLDELIREYGNPDFCKIDVEGFELEVLKGLSVPLPAMSVEYLPSAFELAEECLDRIIALGNYEFNISERETMRFIWHSWKDDRAVRRFLRELNLKNSAGDIYARLKEK